MLGLFLALLQEIQFVKPAWGREGGTEPEHQSIFLYFKEDKECQQCLACLHDKYIQGMTSNKRALGL